MKPRKQHDRIYLAGPEVEDDLDGGQMWCKDRMSDGDTIYVRLDIVQAAILGDAAALEKVGRAANDHSDARRRIRA